MSMTLKSFFKSLLLLLIMAAATYTVRDMVQDISAQQIEAPVSKPAASSTPVRLPATPFWQALHETGNLEEYSWWRVEGVPSGTLTVVPDPTDSHHGFVLRGEITSPSPPPGDSHRLYPAFMLPECYRGAYTSTFSVWADLPPHSTTRGWLSFATYSNKLNWKDLYGVNLGHEAGEDRLILFHVPVFGKGTFTRVTALPFPMKQWVKITVKADEAGIMLFQDEHLVAESKKNWGAEGVGLCEAHWGLYGQGKTSSGVLLNDDLSISFEQPYNNKPRMVRSDKKK